MAKEEQKIEQRYNLIEVPTQMGVAFKDSESEEPLDQLQMLCKIANDLAELKKQLM